MWVHQGLQEIHRTGSYYHLPLSLYSLYISKHQYIPKDPSPRWKMFFFQLEFLSHCDLNFGTRRWCNWSIWRFIWCGTGCDWCMKTWIRWMWSEGLMSPPFQQRCFLLKNGRYPWEWASWQPLLAQHRGSNAIPHHSLAEKRVANLTLILLMARIQNSFSATVLAAKWCSFNVKQPLSTPKRSVILVSESMIKFANKHVQESSS